MAIDAGGLPWKDHLASVPPQIKNGELPIPAGPEGGAEASEEAVRARPPQQKR